MKKELRVIKEQDVLGRNFKIYGDCDNPLFLAKDVAEWIEHSNSTEMLRGIDEDEKLNSTILSAGQKREVTMLTEDGLYEVLMQSRKPIAKQFKKEVKKILKEIRVNGGYISVDATLQQRQKLFEKPLSMRGITKTIHGTDIKQLEEVVKEIIEINCICGKKERIDKQLKDLNSTEYKQHVRKHIRYAIETMPYSDDRASHALEIATRDKIVIDLLDNVLETKNRSFGHMVG